MDADFHKWLGHHVKRCELGRQYLSKSAWVCVLGDDDTYTGLDGCWISPTTAEQMKALDDGEIGAGDLPLDRRFSLSELVRVAIDMDWFDAGNDRSPFYRGEKA